MMTTRVNRRVYDDHGRIVPLGKELGSGGEGSVFAVAGRPNVVAKVYHRGVDAERALKISSMVQLRTDRLLRLAAWPVSTLKDASSGSVVGLLMPKAEGFKEIHALYGPQSRLMEFPKADWRFLVHAAANLARAFAVIHEHGHVIGDVNPGNVLVSSDRATVMLIDCDSFQVAANGRRFLCEVGVSTHQPPELQGLSSFRGLTRTPNHDNFGLAVLIFQLLFMGRHPFAGRYLDAGDMPIERAISEFRFAYGGSAASRRMRPPPHALPVDAASPPVARLFDRAFSPQGARSDMRPTAREWEAALGWLVQQLEHCPQHSGYWYWKGGRSCPWCEIEPQARFMFFNVVVAATRPGDPGAFDVVTVWAKISAVPAPGPAPPIRSHNSLQVQPSTTIGPIRARTVQGPPPVRVRPMTRPPALRKARQYAERRRERRAFAITVLCFTILAMAAVPMGGMPMTGMAIFWILAGSGSLVLLVGTWGVSGPAGEAYRELNDMRAEARRTLDNTRAEARGALEGMRAQTRQATTEIDIQAQRALSAARTQVRRAVDDARSCWHGVGARWKNECGDEAFRAAMHQLEQARHEHSDLPSQHRRRLQQLEAARRDRQFHQFLRRHRIGWAKIPGIGDERAMILQSYGIETADDVTVTAVMAVPGFGQTLTQNLVNWRRGVERRFAFDPKQGIDPADRARLEQATLQTRTRLELTMQNGPARLLQIRNEILASRQRIYPEVVQAGKALAQAEANLQSLTQAEAEMRNALLREQSSLIAALNQAEAEQMALLAKAEAEITDAITRAKTDVRALLWPL